MIFELIVGLSGATTGSQILKLDNNFSNNVKGIGENIFTGQHPTDLHTSLHTISLFFLC